MLVVRHLLRALALAAALAVPAAHAGTFVDGTGDTTGSPTFNRPVVSLTELSAAGTDVPFDSFAFSVDAAGAYTFRSFARPVLRPAWDNFLVLYQGAFDPADALAGAVAANDDLDGVLGRSGFDVTLATNTVYVLVTTGFENFDAGEYITVIRGPGDVTSPVPEPETLALLLAGLGVVGWSAQRRRAA